MSTLKNTINSLCPVEDTAKIVNQTIKEAKAYVLEAELKLKDQFMELLQLTLFTIPDESKAPKHYASLQFLKTVIEAEVVLKEAVERCEHAIGECARVKISYSTLTDEDKDKLEKLDDTVQEFFYTFDERSFWTYGERNIKELITRVELFGRAMMEFRFWDTQFNVELFADTLIETGKHIRDHGHCVNNEKRGRECMAAGGMLKKAYREDCPNVTWDYYYEQAQKSKLEGPLVRNISAASNHPERVDKILELATRREYNADFERKRDAWASITKICPAGPTNDIDRYHSIKIDHYWD